MRVLVVDDSTLFRKVVRDSLHAEADLEVVGTAPDGKIALEKIECLRPDLVTLDVEMPKLDGLEVLHELAKTPNPPHVILVSGISESAAETTLKALSLGAFDFICKPHESSVEESAAALREQLLPRIHALRSLDQTQHESPQDAEQSTGRAAAKDDCPHAPEAIAIGVSTGGPSALEQVLPRLPGALPVPILIVQHMPPVFTKSLAESLDAKSNLTVSEGVDGRLVRPGEVYLAPGGRHMKVERAEDGVRLRITDDGPERNCRPSVDYLFRSMSFAYRKVVGVIMTGMGDDGAMGCRMLRRNGGRILAQSAESCVVYGMPRAIVEEGLADDVRPLNELAHAIEENLELDELACH